MASDQKSNDGEEEQLLSAVLTKLKTGRRISLTPEEAELILVWAAKCDTLEKQEELMQIFNLVGGREMLELLSRRLH